MDCFVRKCDVIVHLAGVNRNKNISELYKINILLAQRLIEALERTDSKPHLILSSSTQENKGNLYGDSKRIVRNMFSMWSIKAKSNFTGLIIPNVFGPFSNPFYNSVIATFCHQLTHNQEPKIDVDSELNLIYVDDLVDQIMTKIELQDNSHHHLLESDLFLNVSHALEILKNFKEVYFDCGEIPDLKSKYEIQLFNTFRSYIDHNSYYPRFLDEHFDKRGKFSEIIRNRVAGQTSYSTTVPGITRGNHFHTRKIERFTVIKGKAQIQIRKIGDIDSITFELSGDQPGYIDIPIWHTHNIKNIGDKELITIFWINEPYDARDPDTYLEIV